MLRSVVTFSIFGVMALLLLFPMHVYAASDHCPRQVVKTDLRAKLAKTRVYNGSVQGFNDYLGNHDRSEGTVLAFVQTDYREIFVQLFYNFESIPIGNDRYCVMLHAVRGDFYAAPALYMPLDYKRGSCEYEEILKHEKRHLDEVYKYHERNKGRYASFLGRIAQSVESYPPITTKEEEAEVQQDIIRYFDERFHEQQIKALEELGRAQQKIDSPMEYRGVSMRCDNW